MITITLLEDDGEMKNSNLLDTSLSTKSLGKRPKFEDENRKEVDLFDNNTPLKKRTRLEDGRYKGVVMQQNGHWSAQIYANHKRYWLGTFKFETEAAMAYDIAAMKLRSEEAGRNFPREDLNLEEMFQSQHSTEKILNMIKDGSYAEKLADFACTQSENNSNSSCVDHKHSGPSTQGGILFTLLFQKELTPSDVGKLNRLVIPKKHAVKYFPEIPSVDEREVGEVDDVQMILYDRLLKTWKFWYCYWKSSQSFVFTRGWNRFVKAKGLQAKDKVTFYRCNYSDDYEGLNWFCMIDVEYYGAVETGHESQSAERQMIQLPLGLEEFSDNREMLQLQLGFGAISYVDSDQQFDKEDELDDDAPSAPREGIKIFGVQIFA